MSTFIDRLFTTAMRWLAQRRDRSPLMLDDTINDGLEEEEMETISPPIEPNYVEITDEDRDERFKAALATIQPFVEIATSSNSKAPEVSKTLLLVVQDMIGGGVGANNQVDLSWENEGDDM